jgi:hypothetical protein
MCSRVQGLICSLNRTHKHVAVRLLAENAVAEICTGCSKRGIVCVVVVGCQVCQNVLPTTIVIDESSDIQCPILTDKPLERKKIITGIIG